ncbi:MAG: two-component regulator propeller domain-containing protein, partial [Bacteroidota bacterium]
MQWNPLQGQEYLCNTRFIGITDGLSDRMVNCFHQDQAGVMWVGTDYGLNRLNGRGISWLNK